MSQLKHESNSRHVWKVIDKFKVKPFKPVIEASNLLHHENQEKANALAAHYQSISNNEQLNLEFRQRKAEIEPTINRAVEKKHKSRT